MNENLKYIAGLPKILLVDDKKPNLIALSAILEGSDRVLYTATSGISALELVQKHEFALFLLDVQMPLMNGFELAERLRLLEDCQATPIIFVTAHHFDMEHVRKGYESGAVDYLFKPLVPEITAAKVNSFLEMYRHKKKLQEINEELDLRNKELAQSNKALSSFAHIVAHDLTQPLRTIKTFLNILYKKNKELLDRESTEFIDLCQNSAERLDDLIKGLLEYARVDREPRASENFDLDEVCKDVMLLLRDTIESKKAEVIIRSPLPSVNGSRAQIQSVVQNLIDNAVKYQPAGNQPVVEIACEPQGENHYQLSVKDNGIGMDEQHQELAFKIFHRLRTKETYSGAGVGLAICKKIIENNGGKIWFNSEKGKGTTFYFTLSKVIN